MVYIDTTVVQGIEATLNDQRKSYTEKVNALLSGWEHVSSIIAKHPECTPSLIEWANEHTLNLVLRGEWPKLTTATKTHLNVTLQRCTTVLQRQQLTLPLNRCQALIELVKSPWSKPALDAILNGQSHTEDEEDDFCCQEKGLLLKMRLKILCEDRCEDIAVNLAAACVRSLQRNDRLRSVSEMSQVQYMLDVYIVLLYKLKRTHDIVAQLKLMDLKDGLELMQRLSGEKPTKYGTARVWRNSMKAAELVAQYLVTTGMIRPLADVGIETLEQILNSWALLHAKSKDDKGTALLSGIIRKLVEPAESAQHICIFCSVLARHFGDAIKPLVIELYIRALTTDMNEVENQKSKGNKEKVQETAQRLSQEFLKLADYVHDNVGITRECVLTAFSLHPTRECYDRIRELAIACGKVSCEDSTKIKVETVEDKTSLEKTELVSSDLTLDAAAAVTPKLENEETLGNIVPLVAENSLTPTEVKVETTVEVKPSSDQEALILIKGDAVTGSANYDEKAVPSQVLDGEKLGVSPQLCDDLAVVLSSQRYHVLTWWLDWKELSELCERYLANAKEMRNTNKELKYLNIDYSQFKDRPQDDDSVDDQYLGIEKGYERWNDSDYSESETSEQLVAKVPTVKARRTSDTRSLDDSTDSDSENILMSRKRGRPRKVQRLESSDSDIDLRYRKVGTKRSYRKIICSSTESDTNTQDSQTSSLGSDGSKRGTKRALRKNLLKKCITKRRRKRMKRPVESMTKFNIIDENIRPNDGINGLGDATRSDIMTLFSADMEENKGCLDAAQKIISEKRSDPTVIKSLRMFRPHTKKLSQINEQSAETPITTDNSGSVTNGSSIDEKENNIIPEKPLEPEQEPLRFAPMLSTLNMSPMIALKRLDDKILAEQQKKRSKVTPDELCDELRKIKCLTKRRTPRRKTLSPKSNRKKLKLSDILTKSVPGMKSMEFSVMPLMQSTVNVVQLSRSILQNSPNSANTTTASGNTPPRGSATGNNRGSGTIQLPGTPSSTSGHDSGVGMSPAGQTPPPASRPSSLQDVGEEANPPPDTSPGQVDSSNFMALNAVESERMVAVAIMPNQRGLVSSQSPKKSSSTTNSSTEQQQAPPQQQQQQQIVLYKPDGTYHLVSSNIVSGPRGILSVQNFEDRNIGFVRQLPVASVPNSDGKTQATKNAGLPKFQQAFGKTICTLTESTTLPSSSATDTHDAPAAPAEASTNVQQHRTVTKSAAASSNLTKAVQTSAQNASITANIPNITVPENTRQILNIVQSAVSSTGQNASGQTVQLVSNSTPGVFYTHKIPIAGSSSTGTQLISIPATISNSRSPVQVKLNIIKSGNIRSAGGAIQILTSSRVGQPQQSQTQQAAIVRSTDPIMNSSIERPNQSTLEALREFESVLEQVKERDTSQSTATDTTTVQTQTQSESSAKSQIQMAQSVNLTQQMLLQSSSSNGSNVTFQQQQEVYPRKVPLIYTNQMNNGTSSSGGAATTSPTTPTKANTKANANANAIVASCTPINSLSASVTSPVVIATTYCQPAASPALSITSQSSSSPCVTPAPTTTPTLTPTGKAQPQSSSKSAKKANPKTVKVNTQAAAKTTPIPKTTQQKPQEDPETTQRIYAILGQYAEQLRNSPDLNNKPAPRRRSNPPTNPNQSIKRKKSGSGKSKSTSGQTSELSPSADDPARTMGSEDSSGGGAGSGIISGTSGSGLMHIQDSPSAGFSASEETLAGSSNNSQSGTNDNATMGNLTESRTSNATSDSNDGVDVCNVKRQNLIFSESSTGVANQARAVIVQEAAMQSSSVSEALASVAGKMTTGTAVLVSGTNFMLPMNFVKSGQQITVVSGGSKLLAAVPAVRSSSGASGAVSNAFVLQSLLTQANKVIQQQNQQKHQQQQQQQIKIAQSNQIIIPQSASVVRFSNEEQSGDKVDATNKPNTEAKSPTIGLFQHSGVITSNPNIGQRIFSSPNIKLPVKTEVNTQQTTRQQQVVCLTTPVIKEALTETQKATTIALAFTPSNTIDSVAMQKDVKPNYTHMAVEETAKSAAKQKDTEQSAVVLAAVKTEPLGQCNTSAETAIKQEPLSPSTLATAASTSTTTAELDAASQYLVAGGPSSSSDSQESASSTIPSLTLESNSMDDTTKTENGVLCGNARLQEAWDPCEERKPGESSPDTTPWRYSTTCTSLEDQQLKVYTEGSAETSAHNSVLQIINKGQGIEMSNSGVFETKKYFHGGVNNSIVQETFQSSIAKFAPIIKSVKTQAVTARSTADLENQQRIKQQMLERQLKLQKSLSEECEDLGVDEPSTSDLFPEADLQLFETNHSPSYDHSSQEATCSQTLSVASASTSPLSGIKPFVANTTTALFFKTADPVMSNASIRDASSVVAVPVVVSSVEPKKKPPQKRTTKPKSEQTVSRRKKRNLDGPERTAAGANSAKQPKLNVLNRLTLSQDEASNSNSGLSPGNNEAIVAKRTVTSKAAKNGAKSRHDAPIASSSGSSSSSQSLDLKTSSRVTADEVARRAIGCNNVVSSIAVNSSGEEDESLAMMENNLVNSAITTSMSPIERSLLLENRYTYMNSKKRNHPAKRTGDFFSNAKSSSLSWDSPGSERTQSSTDDEVNDEDDNEADESSISESFTPTPVQGNVAIGNGLETASVRTTPVVKATPIDHVTYSAKKKKSAVIRRTTVNHRDSNIDLSALNKSTEPKSSSSMITGNSVLKSSIVPAISATLTPATTTTSENESLSPVPPADKLYDINPSDDEALMTTLTTVSSVISGTVSPVEHCSTARRSSLRGHVKKGCGCCNGSPERPKSKKTINPKQMHVHQQQQQADSSATSTSFAVSVTTSAPPAKIKKMPAKHQQTKQPAKKR